jgi:hypothetical protein
MTKRGKTRTNAEFSGRTALAGRRTWVKQPGRSLRPPGSATRTTRVAGSSTRVSEPACSRRPVSLVRAGAPTSLVGMIEDTRGRPRSGEDTPRRDRRRHSEQSGRSPPAIRRRLPRIRRCRSEASRLVRRSPRAGAETILESTQTSPERTQSTPELIRTTRSKDTSAKCVYNFLHLLDLLAGRK